MKTLKDRLIADFNKQSRLNKTVIVTLGGLFVFSALISAIFDPPRRNISVNDSGGDVVKVTGKVDPNVDLYNLYLKSLDSMNDFEQAYSKGELQLQAFLRDAETICKDVGIIEKQGVESYSFQFYRRDILNIVSNGHAASLRENPFIREIIKNANIKKVRSIYNEACINEI